MKQHKKQSTRCSCPRCRERAIIFWDGVYRILCLSCKLNTTLVLANYQSRLQKQSNTLQKQSNTLQN